MVVNHLFERRRNNVIRMIWSTFLGLRYFSLFYDFIFHSFLTFTFCNGLFYLKFGIIHYVLDMACSVEYWYQVYF